MRASEIVNVRDERIVYCREIDPDSLLHLTVVGDRYIFRRFDGTHPFAPDDAEDYEQLKRCYRFSFDRPLTGEERAHSVEEREWWTERMAGLNKDLERIREGVPVG